MSSVTKIMVLLPWFITILKSILYELKKELSYYFIEDTLYLTKK